MDSQVLPLFPKGARVNDSNHLEIGGIDVVQLAAEYGTPLYVFDEQTLRDQCRAFLQEFTTRYPSIRVLYASKAFLSRPIARIIAEEGLGLDVVSGGELAIAQSAKVPPGMVYFHGNNKSAEELRMAVRWNIGRVVVDNFHELDLLHTIAKEIKRVQPILLRISPGVDPHTHKHTTTGILDSKFGFALSNGQAEDAVQRAMAATNLDLKGLHIHLGSPIYETDPYREGIHVAMEFAAAMRQRHGLTLEEFSPGGGFPIQYTVGQPPPPLADHAQAITEAVSDCAKEHGLAQPLVTIEPGRAIVGRAGVALYTVGAIKDIPGVRKYVSVDGGMGDNIRPAIYGSRYEAMVAGRAISEDVETVTIAGKFCESGDVLIRDITLPKVTPGDVIAIPASGAYCLPMASNYNSMPRPAILLINDGHARVIRRRETFDDLMQWDVD